MKDQKELGKGDFSKIPNGIAGVEHRMELIYQGVVLGEISLERWVETCCTTPARMFGMYPKKGIIAPGSDADIVVWDPTPYLGIPLEVRVETTIVRGAIVYHKGKHRHGPAGNEVRRTTPQP